MGEREWIDVEDWGLRHTRAGAGVRETSIGGIETDERGAVLKVARVWAPQHRDEETGQVVYGEEGELPTREDLLGRGYVSRQEYPLEPKDRNLEPPLEPETPPERKVAPVTTVEPQNRAVAADPGGEMGVPLDLGGNDQDEAASSAQDLTEDYRSPFAAEDGGLDQGVPEDPAAEVAAGRAEVIGE